MTNLPNDISRCTNDSCPLRNDCERYLQRDTGITKHPFAPYSIWNEQAEYIDECDMQIKPKQDE